MLMPPWSASSLDSFTTCPHKYYRLRVIKDVKDLPPSDAILYGRKLHKDFENAVNLGDPLPESMAHWQGLVDKLKALPGEKMPEHWFYVDEDLLPCARNAAWTRGAADLIVKHGQAVAILDYKTGKRRPSDQLALYAAFAFATWPEVQEVQTMYIWLKERKIDRKVYKRDDAGSIWNLFIPAVNRMKRAYETGEWPKHPSGLCKAWCSVVDCPYCGK